MCAYILFSDIPSLRLLEAGNALSESVNNITQHNTTQRTTAKYNIAQQKIAHFAKQKVALVESMAWPVSDARTVVFSGKRNARYFFGTGKFEELKEEIASRKADILYVDTEQLTPNQLR